MKKLYIVDFQYQDKYEDKNISDRWSLACENKQEIHDTMEKNFKELKRYGYEPIRYSFREISETDNGFQILLK